MKSLKAIFAAITLVGGTGSLYYLDKSMPHGYTNPYHETFDSIRQTGGATEAQKVILVQAAIESAEDIRTSNKFTGVFGVGLLGFSLSRRRKP